MLRGWCHLKIKAFKFQKAASNHVWLNVTNCMMMGAVNVRFWNRSGRNGCGVAGFWKRTLTALPSRFYFEAICLAGFLRCQQESRAVKAPDI
jgi:hypothetical protein